MFNPSLVPQQQQVASPGQPPASPLQSQPIPQQQQPVFISGTNGNFILTQPSRSPAPTPPPPPQHGMTTCPGVASVPTPPPPPQLQPLVPPPTVGNVASATTTTFVVPGASGNGGHSLPFTLSPGQYVIRLPDGRIMVPAPSNLSLPSQQRLTVPTVSSSVATTYFPLCPVLPSNSQQSQVIIPPVAGSSSSTSLPPQLSTPLPANPILSAPPGQQNTGQPPTIFIQMPNANSGIVTSTATFNGPITTIATSPIGPSLLPPPTAFMSQPGSSASPNPAPFLVPVSFPSNATPLPIGHQRPSTPTNLDNQHGFVVMSTTSASISSNASSLTGSNTSLVNSTTTNAGAKFRPLLAARSPGLIRHPVRPAASAADTANVLRRMESQIATLQSIQAPNEAQLTRLNQLIEVRQQLLAKPSVAAAAAAASRSKSPLPPATIVNSCSNWPVSIRPTGATTTVSSFVAPSLPAASTVKPSESLRRKYIDVLGRHRLLQLPSPSEEVFTIEYRLKEQRYHLRMTKSQKLLLGKLLERYQMEQKGELLSVMLHEQTERFRSLATTTTNALPFSQQQPTQPTSTTFPVGSSLPQFVANSTTGPSNNLTFATPGLRFVATSVPPPPRPVIGSGQLPQPVVGNVIPSQPPGNQQPVMGYTFAMPPGVKGQPTTVLPGTLPPSSTGHFAGQTFLVQQPTPTSQMSSSQVMMTPPRLIATGPPQPPSSTVSTVQQPQQIFVGAPGAAGGTLTLAPGTPIIVHQPPPPPLPTKLRKLLDSDQAVVTQKVSSNQMVSNDASSAQRDSDDLLSRNLDLLAPYHVLQDFDNTQEAIEKVDKILDDAWSVIKRRKTTISLTVDALVRKEKSELYSLNVDKCLITNMALDLDTDVVKAEKAEFSLAGSTETLPSTSYLYHPPPSILPEPWDSLLGSLAYLRPRQFDAVTGQSKCCLTDDTTFSLKLPDWPIVTSSHQLNGNDSTNDPITAQDGFDDQDSSDRPDNDSSISGDDNEDRQTDLLLGLGRKRRCVSTPPARNSSNETLKSSPHPHPNVEEDVGGSLDEAFGIWDELMHEDGSPDGRRSDGLESSSSTRLEANNCSDHQLATTSSSRIGDTDFATSDMYCCSTLDRSSSQSSRLADNSVSGCLTNELQHSEDPDIDAAIRSILSSSN